MRYTGQKIRVKGLDPEYSKRGECDIAPIHLLDPDSGEYNRPFLTPELELVGGYRRLQGILYRKGDARFEGRSDERGKLPQSG
jgi:putative molybdopterin biosynthesis protein